MWTECARHSSARKWLSTLPSARATPCALRSMIWAPTEKKTPSDAAVPSHQLLLRAGFVRRSGHGLFALLPLGHRVMGKLEALIDDEMQKIGGNRVDLTILTPNDIWKQSGRWQSRGPELMTLKDRREDHLILGPTHEESITSLVALHYNAAGETDSSLRLYQIGRKFRDEIRPRFGLLRAREFIMKDMYSFDVSYEKSMQTYHDVTAAYNAVLISRLRLPVRRVEADSGNIGGNLSHEFHVLADVGEDAILSCSSVECDYAANVEKAEGILAKTNTVSVETSVAISTKLDDIIARLQDETRKESAGIWKAIMELQEVAGTQGFSIKFVYEQKQFDLKNGKYEANPIPRMALCFARHDREVNPLAAKPYIGGDEGEIIENKVKIVELLSNCDPASKLSLLLDDSLKHQLHASLAVKALCAVAELLSKQKKHTCIVWGNFRLAQAGDWCPRCNGGSGAVLEDKRGIEVGHVFYLGQKYSKPFCATHNDAKNKSHPLEMGCYGLGVSRLIAAAVEASHDEYGIVWPTEIAPYKVLVMSIGGKKRDDPVCQAAWNIAERLASGNVAGLVRDDVLLDDRLRESPGSKLAESELIGYPFRVVLGKRFIKEGLVEVQIRATMEKKFMKPEELPSFFVGVENFKF
ncbi:uncharacterized protein CCR75_001540 [Bremia lactucae]|uniref:proline--tRNA ligase n=1 Tax=Bremia lactucae TaxID=4779 RepID=A0A976FEQ8_BRELC|nr:hypothetical protein CCR75_001540 [Bremia lactucae]